MVWRFTFKQRKLKVRALPKIFQILLKLTLHHLMGNKLYVTKVPTPNFKIMHPDNTVICQVKISRAAMKAQEAAKQQKHLQRRKNNIFSIIQEKHQFYNWRFFYAHNFL
jgi:hypothetical protein